MSVRSLNISAGILPIASLYPGNIIAVQFEKRDEPSFEFTVANHLTAQGFARELTEGRSHEEFLASVGRVPISVRSINPENFIDHLGVIEIGQGLLVTKDELGDQQIIPKFASMAVSQCRIYRDSRR